MIARCEPPPQRISVAEETERLDGLIVDIDRNIFPIQRTNEAVAFGGFGHMIRNHMALHGREQNASVFIFCDKPIGYLHKRSADVLT